MVLGAPGLSSRPSSRTRGTLSSPITPAGSTHAGAGCVGTSRGLSIMEGAGVACAQAASTSSASRAKRLSIAAGAFPDFNHPGQHPKAFDLFETAFALEGVNLAVAVQVLA